jgi:predicted dehydrogenase
MVLDSGQAQKLVETVERTGVVFCVTYNYTGYPMVKQARHMVRGGELGEIRKVIVEYSQGWLATRLEDSGNKQAGWRTDPDKSGIAGAVGDIGSHAENLVSTVTGLEIEAICADLTTFVPGRRLDDDANLLIRYRGGARGVMISSQISTGAENGLSLRVYGTQGGLRWRQEEPNHLVHTPLGEPERVRRRRRGSPPDTRRPSSKPSPTSTSASPRPFGPGSMNTSPKTPRWTSRPSTTGRGASTSSRRPSRAPAAKRSGWTPAAPPRRPGARPSEPAVAPTATIYSAT